jgi:uncharacterized protein
MLAALGLAALMWMQPHAAAPEPVEADPAIFVIRDHDTTVYLFGTLHVLSPGLKWFDGPVEEAFAQSDELVVETVPEKTAAPANLPRTSRPASLPQPAAPMAHAASFLATTQDAVRAGQLRGMALDNGADMVLLRAAARSGKLIEPLETLESQFAMIAKLPGDNASGPAAPDAPPEGASPSELSAAMAQLEDAWANGEHRLFSQMLDEMEVTSPDAYRVLFVERNARWSDWVAGRMRRPGTAFVAIGAAHLAGSDSLLVRLAQRGYISRRVRP